MTEQEHEFAAFLRDRLEELACGGLALDEALDAYCTPGFEQLNDRVLLDRSALRAHAGTARRNVRACTVEVDDVVLAGRRAAARYVLTTRMRWDSTVRNEVWLIADLAADGRLERVVSTSRALPDLED